MDNDKQKWSKLSTINICITKYAIFCIYDPSNFILVLSLGYMNRIQKGMKVNNTEKEYLATDEALVYQPIYGSSDANYLVSYWQKKNK